MSYLAQDEMIKIIESAGFEVINIEKGIKIYNGKWMSITCRAVKK